MLSRISSRSIRSYAISHRLATARSMSASLEGYGDHLFKGRVAAPYLEKQGLPSDTLDSPEWTTNGNADKVCTLASKTLLFFTLNCENRLPRT